ncbi:hypothetical protein QOT17_023724 [Balamuthia mandrillaris]
MLPKHVMNLAGEEDVGLRVWAIRKLLLCFYIPFNVLSLVVAVLAIWVFGVLVGNPFLVLALFSFMFLIFIASAVTSRSRSAITVAEFSLRLWLLLQAVLAVAFVVLATINSVGILLLKWEHDADDDDDEEAEGVELWAKSAAILCVAMIAAVFIFVPMMVTQLLLVWRLASLKEALTQPSIEGYKKMTKECISLGSSSVLPHQPGSREPWAGLIDFTRAIFLQVHPPV